MFLRMAADTIAVNFALISALLVRFLILFVSIKGADTIAFYRDIWKYSIDAYKNSAWLLTLICLTCFFLNGFYTYGRTYRSRYKAILIFQAVSLSYLIYAFALYFIPYLKPIPRGALIMSWALTLASVGALRIGSALWRRTAWMESRIWGQPKKRPVRNILVIGGAGYIGSVLIRKLLKRGYRVVVLDALLYGDEGLRGLPGKPQFELIHDDMRNIEAAIRAMRGVDVVVHLV